MAAAPQGHRRRGELRRHPAGKFAGPCRSHPRASDHRPVPGLRRRRHQALAAYFRGERRGQRGDVLCQVQGQGRRRTQDARCELADREAVAGDRAGELWRHVLAARTGRPPFRAAFAGGRTRALPADCPRRSCLGHRQACRASRPGTDHALCRGSRDLERSRHPRGLSRLARLRRGARACGARAAAPPPASPRRCRRLARARLPGADHIAGAAALRHPG